MATGEFLFGHVNELRELPVAPRPESLAFNGTYLVFRKLEQDVAGFRRALSAQAAAAGVGADALAARLVGRRRDGTPLVESVGDNDFRYGGDPLGRECPMASHIRRTNPRDSFGPDSLLVNHHRILRRGMSYGLPFDPDAPDDGPRGLNFIALNASIADQFEFVQSQWLMSGNDLYQGLQDDPICGQRHTKSVVVPDVDGRPAAVSLPAFVTMRGGEYFFLPSLSALREMLSGRFF